ncbi:MAG TPA: AmmeMemoRadiSam system protein B [Thermoanaerobaculia bacterium]
MNRSPAVAGIFYESSAAALRKQVEQCLATNERAESREQFIGAVVPHAGLMYSGHVAAALYDRLDLPKRLILLGPNHTGLGSAAAIHREGAWTTPLGSAPIDALLAQELMAASPRLENDARAHAREHSLEVQLPFLQILDPDFSFVPICLRVPSYDLALEIGEAIATVVSRHAAEGRAVGILASSDLNHYENQRITLEKDQRAIDRMLALDPRSLWETVLREDISMCGFIPTTAMLIAAKKLGASRATLVKHATSGAINGDYNAVVGYAAVIVA